MRRAFFIGRWQPFHEGHKKLIETALEKGEDVLIGVRDTVQDEKNPYTYDQRQKQIYAMMGDWNRPPNRPDRIRLIKIPDISAVCYGRDVGYEIRKIQLDAEIEAISGTKIRAEKKAKAKNK